MAAKNRPLRHPLPQSALQQIAVAKTLAPTLAAPAALARTFQNSPAKQSQTQKGGHGMLGRMMQEFAPLLRLQSDMNRAFEGFFDDLPANRPYGASFPGVNAWETSDGAYLEAELPGMTMDDLEVLVRGNEVTINGERKLTDQPNAA